MVNLKSVLYSFLVAILHCGTTFWVEGADIVPNITFQQIIADQANSISFEPQKAKYLRFKIFTSMNGTPAIDELLIYGSNDTSLDSLTKSCITINTSSCIEGYQIHKTENLIDGQFGNNFSWVAKDAPSYDSPQWIEIGWSSPVIISKVIFSRDRSGTYFDRLPMDIEIELSLDAQNWNSVAVIHGTTSELSSNSLTHYGSNWLTSIPCSPREDWALINEGVAEPLSSYEVSLQEAFLAEENALLKISGFADCENWLLQRRYPEFVEPEYKPEPILPLAVIPSTHELQTYSIDDLSRFIDQYASSANIYGFTPGNFGSGPLVDQKVSAIVSDKELYLKIEGNRFLSQTRAVISSENIPTRGILLVEGNRVFWRQIDPLNGRVAGQELELKGYFNKDEGVLIAVVPLNFLPEYDVRGVYVSLGLGCQNTLTGGHPVHFKKANFSARLQYDGHDSEFSLILNSFDKNVVLLRTENQDYSIEPNKSNKFSVKGKFGQTGAELVWKAREANHGSNFRLISFNYDPCYRPWNQIKDYLERLQSGSEDQYAERDFNKRTLIPGAVNTRYVDVKALEKRIDLSNEHEELVSFFNNLQEEKSDSKLLRKVKRQAAKLWGQYKQLGSEDVLIRTNKENNYEAKIQHHLEVRRLFWNLRLLKRNLFLSNEDLIPVSRLLANKRHPFWPSHNYSDLFDSTWNPGGAIVLIDIPWENGRLTPEKSKVSEIVHAGNGVIRNPSISYDASKIYYAHKVSQNDYFRIYEYDLNTNMSRRISVDGPFHDFWPFELPDGDLAFISTRCKKKFICWRPQAFVLYRMSKDGGNIKELSHANLSEFAPSIESDGRILWTRSEYVDKGADYGHTLWTIRPDGTSPELVFGNTINLPQGYANGRRVPNSEEVCCVMISHFGDLNGPVSLIDLSKGPHNPSAIHSITPEVPWPGYWARTETFREPYPVSRDVFLVAHAPQERFGLFLIDRFGNRELLTIDNSIDTICPQLFGVKTIPPKVEYFPNQVLSSKGLGRFTISNVYKGLEGKVKLGTVKYLRVCQEMPTPLEQLDDGTYQTDHEPFMEFYASPVDILQGTYGWPSYVAKGVLGTVEVEEDGSVDFLVPAEKVLFFELLDENYNEIQRMRSVVQLQPGEQRSCIGCHENRLSTPDAGLTMALKKESQTLIAPPWGEGPFWFEKVVQPILDRHCVQCHTGDTVQINPKQIDLTSLRDGDKIPNSYRYLIQSGDVHYFDYSWGDGKTTKADPYSFGTFQSNIWNVLKDKNHQSVTLDNDEEHAFKCWIDLNVPLWGDYQMRRKRQ